MTRLLLFSDLHRDLAAARRLVEMSLDADIVIGAGDLANMHRGLEEMLVVLRQITRPIVLVAGNNETTAALESACADWPGAHVLHGTGVTIEGIEFFGLGGAVPVTPFGEWSYDLDEAAAEGMLAACPNGGVLVSHSPPRGLVDVASNGRGLGSTAVRKVVDVKKPRLVVCGHIHHSGGQSQSTGATTVVNAGPRGVQYTLG